MRKAVRVLALLMLPLFLTGCWSYISLNDIAIVMGMGLDEDPASGGYQITNEIVDFTKSLKESSATGKLVVSEGPTVFEALRDAKRRLINKLYFSNAQVVAFSEALARDKGILNAADWIMRDAEGRETMNLLIAKGGTAHDLLAIKGLDQSIVSLELDAIITEDAKVTSSTAHTELYSAYDILNSPGIELTLPAFIIADNDGQKVAEADGIAAFKGDKLVGYLSKDESKYFLMATNECHGGILAISMHGTGAPDTSLEIAKQQGKDLLRGAGRFAVLPRRDPDQRLSRRDPGEHRRAEGRPDQGAGGGGRKAAGVGDRGADPEGAAGTGDRHLRFRRPCSPAGPQKVAFDGIPLGRDLSDAPGDSQL